MSRDALKIPSTLDHASFLALSEKWKKARNASIELPELAGGEGLIELVIGFVPDEFAYAVLQELAELDKLSIGSLHRLFDVGNPAIHVSLCLRPDLPKDLLERFLTSTDENVLQHVVFNPAVSAEQCQSLLSNKISPQLAGAISRAISQKRKPSRR
jgi:hypothetical protein